MSMEAYRGTLPDLADWGWPEIRWPGFAVQARPFDWAYDCERPRWPAPPARLAPNYDTHLQVQRRQQKQPTKEDT